MSRSENIKKDIIDVLKIEGHPLSASGIIDVLIGKKFRRKKILSTSKYIGKLMKILIGHDGLIGKKRDYGTTRFSEYWYDEYMHFFQSVVDFSKLVGEDSEKNKR